MTKLALMTISLLKASHSDPQVQGFKQYDTLHQAGASPVAFDFKQAFGPNGQPIQINRSVIQAKMAQMPSPYHSLAV